MSEVKPTPIAPAPAKPAPAKPKPAPVKLPTPSAFVDAWQATPDHAAVAKALGVSPFVVFMLERRMRRAGVELAPSASKRSSKAIDATALNAQIARIAAAVAEKK